MPTEHWTIDRRVPVALLFGLLMQAAVAVWWAAGMESRMTTLEQAGSARQARLDALDNETQRMQVAAATVTAQLQAVRDSLAELKAAQIETNNLLREYLQNRQ